MSFLVQPFLNELQAKLQALMPDVIKLRDKRTMKHDFSFVTEGDLMINETVLDICQNSSRPILVVTEESLQHKSIDTNGLILVLDPIDGTENFTSGLPEWGVSVSVFEGGRHIGSLIGCPEMNIWLQSGREVHPFYSRIRGLSSSLQIEDIAQMVRGHEYRILGCCVYNMVNVIRGSFLSFENPKGAHSWDILGGLNLALEQKLNVTVDDKPYSGEYLQADRKYRFRIWRE